LYSGWKIAFKILGLFSRLHTRGSPFCSGFSRAMRFLRFFLLSQWGLLCDLDVASFLKWKGRGGVVGSYAKSIVEQGGNERSDKR
jgi:hypothetical protein